MVATRRGVRVSSPTTRNHEQASDVQATLSTGRRTKSAASQVENSTRRVLVETGRRLREEASNPQTHLLKRCARASRLHSPEQPCTPVSSTHEADVSDLESCSSAMSDAELTVTRSRAAGQEEAEVVSCSSKNVRSSMRRTSNKKVESGGYAVSGSEPPATCRRRSKRLAVNLNYEDEEVSDADSCFSLASAQKAVRRTRISAAAEVDPVKDGDKVDSCSSLPTESQRVTGSQRKSTRLSVKPQPQESDLSEAESFASDVSGASASQSSIRRSARSRNKLCPIPFNLDETSESSPSSRRTTRQTMAENSCDSESFESGSEYATGTQRRVKTRSSRIKTAESDSDLTDGHSALGSPCSSRTDSGSARQQRPTPIEGLGVIPETSPEGTHDSLLESTVVTEDADSTLLEEEKQANVMSTDAAVNQVRPADLDEEEVLAEAAVAAADQQGELSAEKQEEDASAVEKMEEETGPSPSGARCEDVGAADVKDDSVRMEVVCDDQSLRGVVTATQEEEEDMEVERVTCQEAIVESSKEEEEIGERTPEELMVSIHDQVIPEDMEVTEKMSTSSPVVSREEDEEELEEADAVGTQGPSRKPEETVATVVEHVTPMKSPCEDMKATQKTKTVSLYEEEEKEEKVCDQEGEDTGEAQGPSRKPEETAATKSPPKDMKATPKTKTVSLYEEEEEEKVCDQEGEDTGERGGPYGRPEEAAATVVEQVTTTKSPSKDMKATPKTKTVSLYEHYDDEEGVSAQEGEDTEETQGPSRKPEETAATVVDRVPSMKSPSQGMKATQKTKTVNLYADDDDDDEEDVSDQEDENTEERQGPSSKLEEAAATVVEQVTSMKSPSRDMKAIPKIKTVSLLESSEDEEEEEDVSDQEDENTEERPGPSSKPEETAATVVEQVTSMKSPSRDMKAIPKTKIVSLLESSEDEDEEEDEEVSDQEDEDTGERRGPSRKPEKEAVGAESADGLFVMDTRPGQEVDQDYYTERLTREEVVGAKKEEEDEEFVDEEEDEDDCGEAALLSSSRNPLLKEMSSRIDPGINMRQLGGLYITFDGSKSKPGCSSVSRLKEKKDQDEVMKKSVMGSDFEKKDAVPPYTESKKALKQKRRVEREKTTGDAWFNMKAPELTKELKGDLKLLKMRGSVDPKRFYKKDDRDGFPKYFQVATVMDNPVDFYHSRIPKKQRKRTMVEELLADAEFRGNNKKKYQNIVAEKAAQASGKHKKFKKDTFHKKSGKVPK